MKILIFFFIITTFGFAQTEKLQEQKEMEVVNFQNIKKILIQDGLSEAAQTKEKQLEVIKTEQAKVETQRHGYPTEPELWGLLTDYWLIKNAQLLNWDFDRPDYGLERSFNSTMEAVGFYQKKYRILILNSPNLVRASLPGNEDFTLIISLPFMKSLDLSRLEISLLLLEDFIRLEQGYFKKNVATERMMKLTGTNFAGANPDPLLMEELLKKYSHQILEKGYSFQQMFEVTKKMDAYLKSNLELWNTYFRLLSKIDRFIKTNSQFKDYPKLYPSPEMQIKWITPEEKVL